MTIEELRKMIDDAFCLLVDGEIVTKKAFIREYHNQDILYGNVFIKLDQKNNRMNLIKGKS